MAIFAGQTALNTLVFGWASKKLFETSGLRAYATGLGASLTLSAGLFAYAYHERKQIELSMPKPPPQVGPTPKVGALVSPEF